MYKFIYIYKRINFWICLFLDLRKAFGIVNVENLVEKLKMCGISGTASLMINSYLSNMDQYVVTIISQMFYLLMQEFNIFINDISQLGMKNVLYADDAVFFMKNR